VDLDVARLALAVEGRTKLNLGELDRSATCDGKSQKRKRKMEWEKRTLDLDELVLLNNIGKLLALVLALHRRLLQVVDLLVELGEAERVIAAVGDTADEGCARVLEGL
jgi:7,8-dihydro-6-hydroxymethylpterin-pyrophosphokinase